MHFLLLLNFICFFPPFTVAIFANVVVVVYIVLATVVILTVAETMSLEGIMLPYGRSLLCCALLLQFIDI